LSKKRPILIFGALITFAMALFFQNCGKMKQYQGTNSSNLVSSFPAPSPTPSPTPTPQPSLDPNYCDESQTSIGLPITLHRQCHGDIYWGMYRPQDHDVPWISASIVFHGGSFGSYAWAGATIVPAITQGLFFSIAFNTSTINGYLHLTVNPTYGGAGMISVSTTPGDFSPASANNLCSAADGGDEIAATGTKQGIGYCNLKPNTTYYLNITTVHADGTPVERQPIAYGIGNS
jgi:hypothetical protein